MASREVERMGAAYEVLCSGRDRGEWLRLRREGIGGSDAAAVLGVSPWASAMSIYTDKIGLAELDPDEEVSEQARWGKILEPHLVDEFARRTGRRVRPDGRLIRSRARPWQITTLDARQRDRDHEGPGLVEAKTTRFEWERIPDEHWAQMQHEFAVTGFRWGSFVVLDLMRREVHWIDVEPDRDYVDELIEREREFWRNLLDGVPPPPDQGGDFAEALQRLYPVPVEGKVVELPADLLDLSEELQDLRDHLGADRKRRTELEDEIKAAIGEAEAGTFADGTGYTYKAQHREERIQKASTFRVLRYTGRK